MNVKKATAADLVALLLSNAVALRKAGVVHLKLDGCEVTFTPHVDPVALGPTPEALGYAAALSPNAVDDLLTFGGRPMPSLRRPGQ